MTAPWGLAFGIGGAALGSLGWAVGSPGRTGGERLVHAGAVGLGAGLLCGALAIVSTSLWRGAFLDPFVVVLTVCGSIDARTRVIPNRLIYPALAVYAGAIVATAAAGGPLDLATAGIGFAVFGGGLLAVALAMPHGMGMGDVKLAALIGLVLGATGLRAVEAAAVGALLGGAAASIALLVAGGSRKATLPFGPFLAIGGLVGSFLAARPLA